jgi:hypothetical protein
MLLGQYAYEESKNPRRSSGFYPLLMAALRVADPENMARVRAMFPDVVAELEARYNAPGGVLSAEEEQILERIPRPDVWSM